MPEKTRDELVFPTGPTSSKERPGEDDKDGLALFDTELGNVKGKIINQTLAGCFLNFFSILQTRNTGCPRSLMQNMGLEM